MKSIKILITGCSGFLSEYLTKDLLDEGHRVTGITEIEGFKKEGVEVCRVDIRDYDSLINVIKKIRPELVFHLAAVSNVGFSWKEPLQTFGVNISGSANLIEACRRIVPDSRILLMSSAEVYDSNRGEKLDENSPLDLSNPYALSKFSMEQIGDLYCRYYNIDVLKVRSFNFTGPGQNKNFVVSDFSHQIAEIEKGLKEPEIRVGNISVKRDFSDVRDIVRYLRIFTDRGVSGEMINLCSGNVYSIKEILTRMLEMSRVKIRVIEDSEKFRISDTPVISGDCSKLRSEYGLVPQFSIDRTLKDSLEFWRNKI